MLSLILALFPPLPVFLFFLSGHALATVIVCYGSFMALCLPQVVLGSNLLAHTLPRVKLQNALLCCLHRMVASRNETAEFGMRHPQLIT